MWYMEEDVYIIVSLPFTNIIFIYTEVLRILLHSSSCEKGSTNNAKEIRNFLRTLVINTVPDWVLVYYTYTHILCICSRYDSHLIEFSILFLVEALSEQFVHCIL